MNNKIIFISQIRTDYENRDRAEIVGQIGQYWYVINLGYGPRLFSSEEINRFWPKLI
jgi:hypothetical protein